MVSNDYFKNENYLLRFIYQLTDIQKPLGGIT